MAKARRDGPLRTLATILSVLLGQERTIRLFNTLVSMGDASHELHGVTIPLEHHRVDDTIIWRFVTGEYESEERWLIESYLPRDADVIELGGGLGYISCVLNGKIAEDRSQIVVEADEDLIPIIDRSRSINGCDFTILHRAYYPGADEVGFRRGTPVTTGSVDHEDAEIEVESTSLRKIVEEHNITEFSLVVDVEGVETVLIDEELELLKEKCRTLIIEFHHPERRRNPRIERKLLNAGFVHRDDVGGVFVYEKQSLT